MGRAHHRRNPFAVCLRKMVFNHDRPDMGSLVAVIEFASAAYFSLLGADFLILGFQILRFLILSFQQG